MSHEPPASPSETPEIREIEDRFIAVWSRMGSQWGIPRTMAEIHALLYVAGAPLNAEDVMARLGVSRGNVSMTLRALLDWGLVERVHQRGDRRDYFVAEQDLWKLFRTILAQRKQREIDPLIESLQACLEEARPTVGRKVDPQAARLAAHTARVESMLSFVQMVDGIVGRLASSKPVGLEKAAKLLARVS